MPEYRLLFIGPDDRFAGRRAFAAADDAAALHAARSIYARLPTPHRGFELWQDRRCVYAERKNGAPKN